MSANQKTRKDRVENSPIWGDSVPHSEEFHELMCDLFKMSKKLDKAKRYNKFFRKCLHRAQKLYYEKHPEAEGIMDGAENLAWLLEQIKALEEEMEWKPMDIAPLDGTPVLLVEDERIYIASWHQNCYVVSHEDDPFGWCISESYQDEQGGFAVVDHPSGWKPLPKPPINILEDQKKE